MPAYLTHRVAGERVLEKLKAGDISQKKAFFLGCQGPDLLFFRNYQPWRSAKESLMLGFEMHSQKVRELMKNALEYARTYGKKDKDELISYIAGFITHYAIDKNAHPFVNSKAGKDYNIHHATEFMWDSYCAKEQWGIEPEEFNIYTDVMNNALGDGVCDWYKTAAKEVYNREIKADIVLQAQKHLAKAKKMLADIGLTGKILIKIVSGILKFDVRTMLYPEQRDESMFSKEEYKSMQVMIAKGVDQSSSMIAFALDYIFSDKQIDLPEWFGDTDFSGEIINA